MLLTWDSRDLGQHILTSGQFFARRSIFLAWAAWPPLQTTSGAASGHGSCMRWLKCFGLCVCGVACGEKIAEERRPVGVGGELSSVNECCVAPHTHARNPRQRKYICTNDNYIFSILYIHILKASEAPSLGIE